ncbi:hypothetical protein A2765_02610 [Candidatus Kaiserbacteria bacterium RIFCSPHIGHO2_01_FULL_56_24]|uniref:Uncharacterized protein n=1 Tax=Candidatus Kaiserbacteria bacterium RIFCSPHIGHO2_01_FULL_56_24 TaxID=1798487 RepID=A0A1F6DAZ6_9BACT|nr:MAG: hypothetical protein A2765_02610 [Candidatus Kaiserbacteria bacterium RIFCSPHIGHO2_01_FULL_56_24]
MKYIIHTIPVGRYFISWLESEAQYRQDDAGMANGMQASMFFSTKGRAVSDARARLRKQGIYDENILVA